MRDMAATKTEALTFGAITILSWALFISGVLIEGHCDGQRGAEAHRAVQDATATLRALGAP